VLFTSIILMTVGYAMMYSALHGHWNFWIYLFPKSTATVPSALAPKSTTGSVV
jgi:hypothetical protein